jgi:hypothetical protein
MSKDTSIDGETDAMKAALLRVVEDGLNWPAAKAAVFEPIVEWGKRDVLHRGGGRGILHFRGRLTVLSPFPVQLRSVHFDTVVVHGNRPSLNALSLPTECPVMTYGNGIHVVAGFQAIAEVDADILNAPPQVFGRLCTSVDIGGHALIRGPWKEFDQKLYFNTTLWFPIL